MNVRSNHWYQDGHDMIIIERILLLIKNILHIHIETSEEQICVILYPLQSICIYSVCVRVCVCVCVRTCVCVRACMHVFVLELGSTQILEMVRYFIKYHGINNYHNILINAFMYPVKYSNNFS